MRNIFASVPFIFLIFFLHFSVVKAQILINEFSSGSSSDWVELYNIASVSADLSKYKLMDSGTNDKSLTGIISPGGFISFSFSNWLNNSTPDGVRLYSSDILVDSIYYGSENQVCFPSDTGSIGRYPDGGNTIDRFLGSTRDLSNNLANLYPCPSPTPSINPTTSTTVAPVQTPSPTVSSVPTPTPVRTYTPKPTSTTPQILGEEVKQTQGEDVPSVAESTPSLSVLGSKNNFPYFAVIFIFVGVILVGLSFFLAFKKKTTSQPDSLV